MASLKGFAAAAILGAVTLCGPALADVVVLKGGTVVPLKEPWVRRGNTAYLTRADGTLLSVPVTEIDREATAAANRAAASPPAPPAETAPASTPAEAARVAGDQSTPKARVRITDADVSHPLEYTSAEAQPEATASAAAGSPRVEVADYTQELQGDTLVIKGSLRNSGQGTAESVRMSVAAVDEKGQPIEGTTASLSKGSIGSGQSVDFTASMKVGEKTVAKLRFSPQWAVPKPAPTPGPGGPASAADARSAPPPPRPTPYGRGNIYAPPVANAPSEAPADGKTGYIPGAANPDQQPRPPSR